MEDAIDKIVKKYNMVGSKPKPTPCVAGDVSSGSPLEENIPIRALVGSLQYVATIARPDISFAVQRVARHP